MSRLPKRRRKRRLPLCTRCAREPSSHAAPSAASSHCASKAQSMTPYSYHVQGTQSARKQCPCLRAFEPSLSWTTSSALNAGTWGNEKWPNSGSPSKKSWSTRAWLKLSPRTTTPRECSVCSKGAMTTSSISITTPRIWTWSGATRRPIWIRMSIMLHTITAMSQTTITRSRKMRDYAWRQ